MPTKPSRKIPSELENVVYLEDLTAIQERVDKCYSSERYEDFQTAVEKIMGRYLKGNIGWAVVVWIITLIGSMLLQKFTDIL
jgi:hypothetical protein